jgi:hypothetical protein
MLEHARRLERDNARLAAELAEFRRTEPMKVAERNRWLDKATRLAGELADARDACRSIWEFAQEDDGKCYNTPEYQAAIDKVKAQVNK